MNNRKVELKNVSEKAIQNLIDSLSVLESQSHLGDLSNYEEQLLVEAREKFNNLEKSLRKNSETKINFESFFKTVTNTLPSLVSYLDCNLNYVYVNSAYERWFGVSKTKCIGSPLADIIGQNAFDTIKCNLEAALAGEVQIFERDIPYLSTEELRNVLIHYIPDRDVQGRIRGLIAIVTDLSAQKAQDDKFRLMIENMSDGFIMQDSDLKIIEFNPIAPSILGLTENQLSDKDATFPIWQAIHEDGTEFLPDEYPSMKALKTGDHISGVIMGIRTASGEQRWIRMNATPFKIKNFTEYRNNLKAKPQDLYLRRVLCTFSDLTEIMNVRFQFERLFTALPDLICMADIDGHFKWVNPSFSRVSGYSAEELLTKNFIDLVHPSDLSSTILEIEKLAQNKSGFQIENRYLMKCGSYRTFSWISQRDPKSKNFYAIGRDITEQKLAEVERQKFQKQIELNLSQSIKSEKAFRTIFDNSPIGMIQLDKNGRYISANSSYVEFLGYSESELAQMTILDVTHPEDTEKTAEALRKSLSEDQTFLRIEKRYLHKSGKTVLCRVTSRTVRLEESGEIYIFSGIENITDLVEKNHQLEIAEVKKKETELYFRIVLDSIAQGVWGLDTEGRLSFINTAGVRALGYNNAEELIGRPMHALVHHSHGDGQTYDINQCPMYEAFRQGTSKNVSDEVLWRKNGTCFPVSYFTAPIIFKNECIGSIVCFVDLTEHKQLQKQIEQERLSSIKNSKLASLGEMSAGVAHEINNPLAIIAGSISLLEKFRDNHEKFSAKIASINRSVERIAKIVRGLKKFSRIDNGADHRPEILSRIVNEALGLTEFRVSRNLITISFDSQTDAKIMCDEVEIEQVIINLINNSIDAVSALKEKWIKIYLFEGETSLILEVKDAGLGISPEVEDRLFEPFFTTKPIGTGTGLGLSITKGILDQHQASIRIKKSESHTCFEIRFPKIVSQKYAS